MRANSGKGKSKNNLHDPALRDHEREQGHSGRSIIGKKGAEPEPSRKPARSDANVS